jgi:hypothetical protein
MLNLILVFSLDPPVDIPLVFKGVLVYLVYQAHEAPQRSDFIYIIGMCLQEIRLPKKVL